MRRLLLLASAVVFVDTVFYAAITPLLPTYVEQLDITKSQAGVLAAAYPAGTFLGALPGGWLAARAGVRPTTLVGLALMGVTSVVFAFGQSVVVLDTARFVQGVARRDDVGGRARVADRRGAARAPRRADRLGHGRGDRGLAVRAGAGRARRRARARGRVLERRRRRRSG